MYTICLLFKAYSRFRRAIPSEGNYHGIALPLKPPTPECFLQTSRYIVSKLPGFFLTSTITDIHRLFLVFSPCLSCSDRRSPRFHPIRISILVPHNSMPLQLSTVVFQALLPASPIANLLPIPNNPQSSSCRLNLTNFFILAFPSLLG